MNRALICAGALLLSLSVNAAAEPACPGTTLALNYGTGATPYVWLRAGGEWGHFLLDYGTTSSTIAKDRFPDATRKVSVGDFTLPGFQRATFQIRDYSNLGLPHDFQLGLIGTDFLSLETAQFDFDADTVTLSTDACDSAAISASGLLPIRQDGFFSHDLAALKPGMPDTPVLWLDVGGVRFWAQIDSGYGDWVRPHTIQVNQALWARLKRDGVHTGPVRAQTNSGCVGDAQVWSALLTSPARITDETGKVLRTLAFAHIEVAGPNGCGGIADRSEPAALVGASILHDLGRVTFDPWNEVVWVAPAPD